MVGGLSDPEGLSAFEKYSFQPLAAQAQPKPKRRPGRPISYTLNPDEDETLTKQDRRKIFRRVANRESARRTRQKRRDKLKVMQDEVPAQACC